MRTDATDRQQEMDSIARPETSDAGRSDTAAALYIDLLRKCLTREVFDETYITLTATSGRVRRVSARLARGILSRMGLELVRRVPIGERGRVAGAWPSLAETMVGPVRLQHLERCIRDVVARRVTGDLIEAGVWRGGVTIFMRGCLAALGETDRTVWVADSFQGLPRPDAAAYPADVADRLWTCPELAVPLEEVRANFARYGLLDGRVRFLAGWFRETLPTAPIERLAILRIDADMYEATSLALHHLYPKLACGGYVIVDDYGVLQGCRRAVDDFRSRHGITEPVQPIDRAAVFWQRANA